MLCIIFNPNFGRTVDHQNYNNFVFHLLADSNVSTTLHYYSLAKIYKYKYICIVYISYVLGCQQTEG